VDFDIFVSKEVGWEMRNESEGSHEIMMQISDKRKVLRVSSDYFSCKYLAYCFSIRTAQN
jgi:hypothetical protein